MAAEDNLSSNQLMVYTGQKPYKKKLSRWATPQAGRALDYTGEGGPRSGLWQIPLSHEEAKKYSVGLEGDHEQRGVRTNVEDIKELILPRELHSRAKKVASSRSEANQKWLSGEFNQ